MRRDRVALATSPTPIQARTRVRNAIRSPLLAVAIIVVFAGTALATDGIGFHLSILSRGTLSESVHYNTGAVKFQTKGSVDFVGAEATFDPLGSSGWHAHQGVVLVTVVSGSLVAYAADCSSTSYAASSAFTESGDAAALVRNESTTTPAVVHVTFIVPAGTTALRIDKPNPGCPQN